MAQTRNRQKPTEEQIALKKFRKLSNRHMLIVESDLTNTNEIIPILNDADRLRKAKNELVGKMRKRYQQLKRTKKYRGLLKAYNKTSDDKKKKSIGKRLNEMQKAYNVTWDYCRNSMIPIAEKYHCNSVFALTKAEDVWSGIEKCLYSDGEDIHFSKYEDLPCLRAKQTNRVLIVKVENDSLVVYYGKQRIGLKIKDRFQQEEKDAILSYLEQPEVIDKKAVEILQEEAYCIDSFRPCYGTLVPKYIRGKWRIFVHITIEGKAKPKYRKDGTPRHTYGKGIVGNDIGTQTVAYTSNTEVGLTNLAERESNTIKKEKKIKKIQRKMDRSRRATNPDNYNEDGTIRKGKKTWQYSKRYKKLREKYRELNRISAVNREYANNELANKMRALGDVLVTEPKNAKRLQKRAKETTKDKNGKINRKKRFGKSIGRRCPGGYQATLKQKFNNTGGIYREVSNNYKASQYDHTIDDYIKKKLSERMFRLKGTNEKVQRDWYSSFLLYCYDYRTDNIDKDKANKEFGRLYSKEKELIDWIINNKIKVLNSGIKIAA